MTLALVPMRAIWTPPASAPKTPPSMRSFSTQATTSDTVTATKPTGTALNDYILAFFNNYDDPAVTATPPSGFTTILGPTRILGNEINAWIFGKAAGGSEPSSYTVTTSAAKYSDLIIASYTGVNLTSPISTSSTTNSGNGTTRTGLELTTEEAEELMVLYSVGYNESPTGAPSGMTQRATLDGVIGIYDQAISSAGATGDKTQTQTATDNWITQMIALRPA